MAYLKLLYERDTLEKRLSKAWRDYYQSIKEDTERLNTIKRQQELFIRLVHFGYTKELSIEK